MPGQTIIRGNIPGIADEDMLQVEIIIAVSFLRTDVHLERSAGGFL